MTDGDSLPACRKRRIKCDEGKPICNNCIKSKRQCEGYNQRVVFKSPLGAIPGGPFGPLPPYHHHPDPTEAALVNAQLSAAQGKASSSSQGPLPIIAPKPPSSDYGVPQYQYLGAYPGLHRVNSASLGLGIHHPHYMMGAMSPECYYAQSSLGMTTSPTQMSQPDLFDFQIPPQQPTPNFTLPDRRHTAHASFERPVVSPTMVFTPPSSLPQSAEFELSETGEVWVLDEDSDALESDDEDFLNHETNGSSSNDIVPLVANYLHAPLNLYGTQARPFYSLADDNVLVNYMPSPADTPLNNPKTATIFWHFVNITAATINPYERNRPDPQRMLSNDPIPKSHQHIWTCELPQSTHHCKNRRLTSFT